MILLDTHALVWWMTDPSRLSGPAREAIADPTDAVLVSAASIYEIEYKRLRDPQLSRLPAQLLDVIPMVGFEWLHIAPSDAERAAKLVGAHRDPWDRILAAQSFRIGSPLVTSDLDIQRAATPWGISIVW